jgi:hypothetical protein
MYTLVNTINNEIIAKLNNDSEMIHKIRTIAVENGDEELSIISKGEAVDYIRDYCDDNLALLLDKDVRDFIKKHCIRVKPNESASYVELMMDNHKCIVWCDTKYYLSDELCFDNDSEEYIYDVLYSSFFLK